MTRLVWGSRSPDFDLGLDRGVVYFDDTGVAWNGLVSVEERSTGEVTSEHYYDGRATHATHTTGDFEAKVSAYTYPDIFSEWDGYSEQTKRYVDGLTYRTQVGEDDYRLHLIYNAQLTSEPMRWSSLTSTVSPSLFSWNLTSTGIFVPGAKPTGHLILNAPMEPASFEMIEDILYGTDTQEPRLPTPDELIAIYELGAVLKIVNHADGTYSATGPDSVVQALEDGSFVIDAPTALYLNDEAFQVSSY